MAKENNLTRIYEAMLDRLGKISNKSEITAIIKEYNKTFKTEIETDNAVKYLSRHNYIKRIFLGFYYINSIEERKRKFCNLEDKELLFSVLNKLGIKWYLGFSSALYEAGEVWQIPVVISIINNKFSGQRKILGINVRFYKIREKLIFGLKSAKTKNRINYSYSVPAKTHLDMVYFRITKKIAKNKEANKYIKKFPKWVEKKLT